MKQEKVIKLRNDIFEVLKRYLPEKHALERANNISQFFALTPMQEALNLNDIGDFLVPKGDHHGISEVLIRRKASLEIIKVAIKYA